MKRSFMLLLNAPFLLAACATSTDPHEGGFLGGVQGLSSGVYEQRLREREERLQRLREEQRELERERDELKQRDQGLARRLAVERGRLRKLSEETRGLQRRIDALRATRKASSGKIARLRKRLAALKRGIASTDHSLDALEGSGQAPDAIERRRAALRTQRKALEKEYQLLLDLTLQLGE